MNRLLSALCRILLIVGSAATPGLPAAAQGTIDQVVAIDDQLERLTLDARRREQLSKLLAQAKAAQDDRQRLGSECQAVHAQLSREVRSMCADLASMPQTPQVVVEPPVAFLRRDLVGARAEWLVQVGPERLWLKGKGDKAGPYVVAEIGAGVLKLQGEAGTKVLRVDP